VSEGNAEGVGGGEAAAGAGLVICAITCRDSGRTPGETHPGSFPPIPDAVPEGLLSHRFSSPELLAAAAGSFTRTLPTWQGEEGPRARVVLGPGSVRIARKDLAKEHRRLERVADKRIETGRWGQPVDAEPSGSTRGEIREWSRKSRARMVDAIACLDLREFVVSTEGMPGMLTLTLPGDWLPVAGTSKQYRRHLLALRKRFARAWGRELRCIWKLEFQRRGAPHTHIFMVVPFGVCGTGETFAQWVSRVWSEIVDHPDPAERAKHLAAGTGLDLAEGLRMTDPKRIAVYFTKHSSANFGDKEYQHVPPAEWAADGTGRFWGVWGLEKTTETVEIPLGDSITAARLLRRWARAQGTTRQVRVWRNGRWRKVRRRVHRMASSSGFVTVNDGAAMGWHLARALDVMGATDDARQRARTAEADADHGGGAPGLAAPARRGRLRGDFGGLRDAGRGWLPESARRASLAASRGRDHGVWS
jgi:hypothetical protein